jgi:predicted nucleic acid-binding protein
MPDFLDASVLVRYLTDDPPEMADLAEALIETENPLLISETALAETAYVLLRTYRLPRAQAMDLLIDLVQRANIEVYRLNKENVIAALLLCRPSGRVSIGDALIWAVARQAQGVVYSFDLRFPGAGIDLRSP